MVPNFRGQLRLLEKRLMVSTALLEKGDRCLGQGRLVETVPTEPLGSDYVLVGSSIL